MPTHCLSSSESTRCPPQRHTQTPCIAGKQRAQCATNIATITESLSARSDPWCRARHARSFHAGNHQVLVLLVSPLPRPRDSCYSSCMTAVSYDIYDTETHFRSAAVATLALRALLTSTRTHDLPQNARVSLPPSGFSYAPQLRAQARVVLSDRFDLFHSPYSECQTEAASHCPHTH